MCESVAGSTVSVAARYGHKLPANIARTRQLQRTSAAHCQPSWRSPACSVPEVECTGCEPVRVQELEVGANTVGKGSLAASDDGWNYE